MKRLATLPTARIDPAQKISFTYKNKLYEGFRGDTIATALYSAISGTKVRRDLAMTGEVTLRGRVLPIGGLKEKALAALRVGIPNVIIPEQNQKELVEIPEDIRRRMKFHPVKDMDEVIGLAFKKPEKMKLLVPRKATSFHPSLHHHHPQHTQYELNLNKWV